MKARLLPVYFVQGRDGDFDLQLGHLKDQLADQTEFLGPVPLRDPLPDAEAVSFPQFLGEANHHLADFKALQVKRKTQGAKFLVFQDNPGKGFQSEIFNASTCLRMNASSASWTVSPAPLLIDDWPPPGRY